ncbi:hypothetical protein [Caulobacter sp. FWC2]|uniref:hypothetical protein n=1 Tax=Caulobacter sp. FWC2 TaxID=69664 RepID=UPI0011777BF1|nr:hypothetical protein [Caulobacter sp. FWC2]
MQALSTDHSARRIALRLNCAHSTVSRYKSVALKLGWTTEHVRSLTDDEIAAGINPKREGENKFIEPDWTIVEAQLRKKGVDRYMLWEEYEDSVPSGDAMSYREFCRRLQKSRKRFGLVMRQEHLAGEKLFVDFMGGRPHWCAGGPCRPARAGDHDAARRSGQAFDHFLSAVSKTVVTRLDAFRNGLSAR